MLSINCCSIQSSLGFSSLRCPTFQPRPRLVQIAILRFKRSNAPFQPIPTLPFNALLRRQHLRQNAPLLTRLIDTEVQRRAVPPPIQALEERLHHGNRLARRNRLIALPVILPARTAVFVPAPHPAAPCEQLAEIAPFDAAPQRLALGVVHRHVQGPEAHAAQADFVAGALTLARARARVAQFIHAVLRASAVYIAAQAGRGARQALEVMVAEVRLHVSEAHDLAAQVALGRASAVGQLVRREARQEEFGVWWLGRVALLRDLEVAEVTQDELSRAGCGFVVGKGG